MNDEQLIAVKTEDFYNGEDFEEEFNEFDFVVTILKREE